MNLQNLGLASVSVAPVTDQLICDVTGTLRIVLCIWLHGHRRICGVECWHRALVDAEVSERVHWIFLLRCIAQRISLVWWWWSGGRRRRIHGCISLSLTLPLMHHLLRCSHLVESSKSLLWCLHTSHLWNWLCGWDSRGRLLLLRLHLIE